MKKMLEVCCMAAMVVAVTFGSGCVTATYVDPNDPRSAAPIGTALEFQDFEKAAIEATSQMLAEGAVDKKGGGRYVLMVGRIKNDTTQNIRSSQLSSRITSELRKSKKVVVTAALDRNSIINNGASDMAKDSRFNQTTVKKANLIAPELELKGSILERNIPISKRQKRTEYYFHLQLVEISTGLVFWEGETPILKQGKNKNNW